MTLEIPRPVRRDAAFDIVFLDRDGTLNTRVPRYVTSPAELHLLPGAAAAVAELNASGARVVLVTNQRGIATGELSPEQLERVHGTLAEQLSGRGAWLDAILVCPHDEGTCRCRKPALGLLEQALAAAPWADPTRCALIGDMVSDVVPATALGMRAVLLDPAQEDAAWETAQSLPAAVDRLLAGRPLTREGII